MQWFKRWKQRQRTNNTLIFRIYDRLYGLRHFYFMHKKEFMQKHDWCVVRPLASFKKWGGGVLPIEQATCYEIGVGNGMLLVGLSLAGMGQIIGTDVDRRLNHWELTTILDRYHKYATRLGLTFPKDLGRLNDEASLTTFLRNNLRVDYRAPYSAMQTDLPSNSVDYMAAITVFEHIPLNELPAIIKEQYRLLKPGGVFHCDIDYRDHSVYDKLYHNKNKNYPRNRYAYLGYSPTVWQTVWQNSDAFYHNRLRTKDYLALFAASGFRVLEIIPRNETPKHIRLSELAKVNIDPGFAHYTTDELLEEQCIFILTKPSNE